MSPVSTSDSPDHGRVLVADIGGTNLRYGFSLDGRIDGTGTLLGKDYPNFDDAMAAVMERAEAGSRPRAAILAVACPAEPEEIIFTNRAWRFHKEELRRRFDFDRLIVVNDFAAVALALPYLGEADIQPFGRGQAEPGAAMVALGPGSGLGVAGLVPAGNGWQPVSGEGGHLTLAAQNAAEDQIISALRRRFGHVSAERVLSGPGLTALYGAIREIRGLEPLDLAPADVVARASIEAAASDCLVHFAEFLGTVAADLALAFGARGGVFIAGGVVPNIGGRFPAARFRARFEYKGRFSSYCAAIPTSLIIRANPALLGLSRSAASLIG